jgi:mitochondrial fission protein ELM1
LQRRIPVTSLPAKSKNCAKIRLFIPQRYEFSLFVTTFANGSGRIDIKLFKYLFCPLREHSRIIVVIDLVPSVIILSSFLFIF